MNLNPHCVVCGGPADHSAMFVIGGQPMVWPVCNECEARGGQPPELLNPETMDKCRLLDILFRAFDAGDIDYGQLVIACQKIAPWWKVEGIRRAIENRQTVWFWHFIAPHKSFFVEELQAAAAPPENPLEPKKVQVKPQPPLGKDSVSSILEALKKNKEKQDDSASD